MRLEVVNTGTELLLGKVINTHLGFFGQELFKRGVRIQRQTTIPDGNEIRTVLEEAFPRTDVILITGGLGPTNDDVTREVVAEMLNRELTLDQAILDSIEELFRSRGLKQNRSNERQAMVPDGATVLHNPNGTAPGLYVPACAESRSPHLFLIPGPPRELMPMFIDQIVPILETLMGDDCRVDCCKNFRIYGVGESSLANKLEPVLDPIDGLELGYCARLGEVDLRLIGSEKVVEIAAEIVRAEYKRQIMTESEDPIEKVVFDLLVARKETVSTAESCTGGFIASTLTNVSGSSAVFHRGFITYSNEAKTAMLGVPPELLEEHGAVSNETVISMSEGCLKRSGADHAIAISGIAGPTGGTKTKKVGTVHIAIASRGGGTFAKKYYQPVERIAFKERVTRLALDLLRQRLQGFALD